MISLPSATADARPVPPAGKGGALRTARSSAGKGGFGRFFKITAVLTFLPVRVVVVVGAASAVFEGGGESESEQPVLVVLVALLAFESLVEVVVVGSLAHTDVVDATKLIIMPSGSSSRGFPNVASKHCIKNNENSIEINTNNSYGRGNGFTFATVHHFGTTCVFTSYNNSVLLVAAVTTRSQFTAPFNSSRFRCHRG